MNQSSPLAFAHRIISQVSRTFAIGIELLHGELGKSVLTAYLLARIVDTIEDDSSTSETRRAQLIDMFCECFANSQHLDNFVRECFTIQGEAAHVELLRNSVQVFALFSTLPSRSAQIIQHWILILAKGMREFVERYPGGVRIQTLEEYHQYCYYVAGTVGPLLTELFYYHSPWITKQRYKKLLQNSERFGEALQTINILKDIAIDAEYEHEIFIPEELLRAHGSSQQYILSHEWRAQNSAAIQDITQLAQKNLEGALEYFYDLPKLAVSIRLFCWLPLVYAQATLRDIKQTDAMLHSGGKVKISRVEVRSLLLAAFPTVCSNKRCTRLIAKVSQQPYVLKIAKW